MHVCMDCNMKCKLSGTRAHFRPCLCMTAASNSSQTCLYSPHCHTSSQLRELGNMALSSWSNKDACRDAA